MILANIVRIKKQQGLVSFKQLYRGFAFEISLSSFLNDSGPPDWKIKNKNGQKVLQSR